MQTAYQQGMGPHQAWAEQQVGQEGHLYCTLLQHTACCHTTLPPPAQAFSSLPSRQHLPPQKHGRLFQQRRAAAGSELRWGWVLYRLNFAVLWLALGEEEVCCGHAIYYNVRQQLSDLLSICVTSLSAHLTSSSSLGGVAWHDSPALSASGTPHSLSL